MVLNYEARWKRRQLQLSLVAGTLVALMVAACGSGTSATTTAAEAGGPPSTDLTVSITEFEFAPNVWTVPAGEEVTITITNDGTLEHEWVLLKQGVRIASEDELPDSEEELEENFVEVEEHAEPGETTTLTFTAPPADTYQVICAIPDHFNSGLEGRLTSTGG